MQDITTIGIDLAKEVFAVCMLDQTGAVVYSKVLKRDAFMSWAEQLSPCAVAMEACGSAHHWGRWFAARGHTARLIAAEFVQPFRKSVAAKNDRNDAEAIAIASRQPTMRYVAIKSVDQQSILAWHRMREGWKEERTALLNQLRGLLGEFGVWPDRSSDKLIRALPGLSEDERLPIGVRAMVIETREQLTALHTRLAHCDQEIARHAHTHPGAKRMKEIVGHRHPHRECSSGHRSGRQRLSLRPPVCRLAWARPPANELGGQDPARSHQPTRRCVLAKFAGAGRQERAASRVTSAAGESQPAAKMDRRRLWSSGLPQDPGGDCQQTCAHDLGDAGQRRAL